MQTLTLPKGGKTMQEGTVVEWLAEEGEPVAEGEPVVLVESDKMVVEITASEDGVLLERAVDEDETVPVGTELGTVGAEGETPTSSADDGASSEPDAAADATDDGEPHGAEPAEDVFYRATPSARRLARERDVSLEAVAAATGATQLTPDDVEAFEAGETAVAAASSASNGPSSDGSSVETDGFAVEPVPNPPGSVLGSPWARVLAENEGVSLEAVADAAGTDRVRAADVEAYVADAGAGAGVDAAAESDSAPSAASSATAATEPAIAREDSLTGAAGIMFERMSRVANEYASTTTVARVDVTDLLDLYDRLSAVWADEQGVPLTLTAFVVRAVGQSLPDYDVLNAEVTDDDDLRVYEDVNVGIAVDSDDGLLVPTIYRADDRSLRELSEEVDRLARGARERTLEHDDLQNGTFTVSNAGSLGAYINTPQINSPQTAILGMCKIFDEAGVVDGEIVPRKMMHLTLTYDHRVVEGATAVGFLQNVKSLLESPEALLS